MFNGGDMTATFETRRRATVTTTGVAGDLAMHRCAHIGPGRIRCARTTLVRPLCPVHLHAMREILIDQQIDGNLGIYAYDPDDETAGGRVMFSAEDVIYSTETPGEAVSKDEFDRRYGKHPRTVAPYAIKYRGLFDGLYDREAIMFANTAPRTNAEFVELELTTGKYLALVATAPIRSGESITVDYGKAYMTALRKKNIPAIAYDPPFGPLTASLYGDLTRAPEQIRAAAAGLAEWYRKTSSDDEARLAGEALDKVSSGTLDLTKLPRTLRSELLFFKVK